MDQEKKTSDPEMRSNSQQIVSYCLGLSTENPGLREVDLEPSTKRGNDKIKMLKQRRNTQKKANRNKGKIKANLQSNLDAIALFWHTVQNTCFT